ncbi:MAG TPA: hypothetical protein EYP29_03180 [Thermoplasmata archaeon]|nr:hypothetical protein [Thermoplasmata archaeon]
MERKQKLPARFLKKDEEGAIGIGTLIVFIAMVLVAAIAAAVLIDTAGNLQSRAKRTGEDAVDDVSGGIQVLNAEGQYNENHNEIDHIRVYLCLYSGTEPVNVGRVAQAIAGNLAIYVAVTDPTDQESETEVFVAFPGSTDSTNWSADEALVDPHGQFVTNGILDQDSIIRITFPVPGSLTNDVYLGPRSRIEMKFMIGAGGTPTRATVYTPGTYSAQNDDWIELE